MKFVTTIDGGQPEKIFLARVMYNQQVDEEGRSLGMIRGYEDGDKLKHIVTLNIVAETPEEQDKYAIAEAIYRQMNHVDGTEIIAARPTIRSMSVGDVLLISDAEGKIAELAVDSFGWKELS